MGAGHNHHSCDTGIEHDRHVLWIALALNFAVFLIEIWQGFAAHSIALLADSSDFFADSFSYALTLFVLDKSLKIRARASLLKAGIMLVLSAVVLWRGIYNVWADEVPDYIIMGWVMVLALFANITSALLLYRHRTRDSNMQSVWLCSRNDAIANVAIMIAAGLIYVTGTLWPDLIVALIIATLGVSAALKIIAQARKELAAGH